MLFEEGALITIADVDEAGAKSLIESLSIGAEHAPIFVRTQVNIEKDVESLINAAVLTWGAVDCLVNNAATFVYGEVTDIASADWDRVLSVNVKGYAFTMKHAIPCMRGRGGGSIVNIASISSYRAQPSFVPYATTKGAILALSRNVALDCGPYNIRVSLREWIRNHISSLTLCFVR